MKEHVKFLRKADVLALFNKIHPNTWDNWVKSGKAPQPCYKEGRVVLWNYDDVINHFNNQSKATGESRSI